MSGQSSIEKGMEGTGCPLLSTPADTLPGNRCVDAPRVGGAGGRVSALPPPTPPVSDAAPPQAVSGAGDVSGLAGGRHSDLSSRKHPSDTPSTSSVENAAHASVSMRRDETTGSEYQIMWSAIKSLGAQITAVSQDSVSAREFASLIERMADRIFELEQRCDQLETQQNEHLETCRTLTEKCCQLENQLMEKAECSKEKSLLQSLLPQTANVGADVTEVVAVEDCSLSVYESAPCSDDNASDNSRVEDTSVASAQESITGGRRVQAQSRQPRSTRHMTPHGWRQGVLRRQCTPPCYRRPEQPHRGPWSGPMGMRPRSPHPLWMWTSCAAPPWARPPPWAVPPPWQTRPPWAVPPPWQTCPPWDLPFPWGLPPPWVTPPSPWWAPPLLPPPWGAPPLPPWGAAPPRSPW